MKDYICKKCGAQMTVEDNMTARCSFCGYVGYLVDIEVGPLRNRLYDIVTNRDRKNLSRAKDIKDLAGEILEKSKDDVFGKFYFALAEKMGGNMSYYLDFLLNADYDACLDEFNRLVLEDIVGETDDSLLFDAEKHIRRVVTDAAEAEGYIARLNKTAKENTERIEQYQYRPRDVFICHSSKDGAVAEKIADALGGIGISAWISTRNIRPNSMNYWQDIEHGIENCRVFLVVSSANSMSSVDCNKELNHADKLEKPRKEYKIDNERHTKAFDAFFGNQQWINAADDPYRYIGGMLSQVRALVEQSKNAGGTRATKSDIEQAERFAELERKQQEIASFAESVMLSGSNASDPKSLFKGGLGMLVSDRPEMAESLALQCSRLGDKGYESLVLNICVCFYKLSRSRQQNERESLMQRIRFFNKVFKETFPVMSNTERQNLAALGSTDMYALLSVYFAAMGEQVRLSYCRSLIKSGEFFDTEVCGEYLNLLYKLKDYGEIRSMISARIPANADKLLADVLKSYKDFASKPDLVALICDKYRISDKSADAADSYIKSSDDGAETVSEITKILSKGGVSISAEHLAGGKLGGFGSYADIKPMLESMSNRSLTSKDVDYLVEYTKKQGAEVFTAILDFLLLTGGIYDIGQQNLKTLFGKISDFSDNDKLIAYKRVVKFRTEPKTKEYALSHMLFDLSMSPASRIETVEIFSGEPFVPSSAYEEYLVRIRENCKPAIISKLLSFTTAFSNTEAVFKRYLADSPDSPDIRQGVIKAFTDNNIGLSGGTLDGIVSSATAYDKRYIDLLRKNLAENPGRAQQYYYEYFRKRITDPGGEVLGFLISRVPAFDDAAVAAFLTGYYGDPDARQAAFADILSKIPRPKDSALVIELFGSKVECNLSQGYILTLTRGDMGAPGVVEHLKKSGVKPDEKIFVDGKKGKMEDFARQNVSAMSAEAYQLIKKYC